MYLFVTNKRNYNLSGQIITSKPCERLLDGLLLNKHFPSHNRGPVNHEYGVKVSIFLYLVFSEKKLKFLQFTNDPLIPQPFK